MNPSYADSRVSTFSGIMQRHLLPFLLVIALAAQADAGTVLQVDQTGEASFSIEYEKTTRIGGVEKAMENAEHLAGALCEAAGFAYYRVLDRKATKSKFISVLPTRGDTAVVEVELLDTAGDDGASIACNESRKKDLREMSRWLKTLRYERPPPKSKLIPQ